MRPDIGPADYALVQSDIDGATQTVLQDDRRLIFIRDDIEPGYILVVKAVVQADELFIVSLRRISSAEARRDRDLRNVLRKAGDGADGGASLSG